MAMPSLTERDPSGTVRLRAAAIPAVIAALALPVVVALLVGVVAGAGIGLGLAAGALAVTGLIVLAARALPDGPIEVATRGDAERRVLVLATTEATPSAVEQVAALAGDADDVRLVVPVRGRQLERWLSATDEARDAAQDALARTAGALVAAGLPVSGALGDGDTGQALEDALRDFAASAVIVIADPLGPDPVSPGVVDRLEVPLRRVPGAERG